MRTFSKTLCLFSLSASLLLVSCALKSSTDRASESSKEAQIISLLADNEDDKALSKINTELAQKVKAISTKKATSAEDFLKRSKEFSDIGECALAIDDLETAVKINPKFGAAYYEIGLNYLNMEDPEEAIKNFDKAISLKFNLSETYLERGLAYGRLNNFQKLAED